MKIFHSVLIFTLPFFLMIGSPVNAELTDCSDESPALNPAPLEEEWAIEWWMPRHEAKLAEDGRESAQLLLIGDSITHGWETTGSDAWDAHLSDYSVYNIGYSGDRTENVLWRFQHGEIDGINPDLAVLMIGTNNTGHRQDPPECTAKGIEMILDELSEHLPETDILLLAIFPRSESANDPLRLLNEEINQKIEPFGEREQVTFVNLNSHFLDDDENLPEDIMPDMLHPNEKGYNIWAKELKSYFSTMLE
ncbi:acetylglucosamine-6-sulfatase [Rhodohalobacter sp. SW132]|uniref:GDSL-type esterase/lipase family protein n=1 Tax=Rhodohalobacter sp. SW132 TaxID=2293433 RepID=UPI000E282E3D|nr:GDSL-type esterase/lipase family protein [Rhodohalobacter sp. SW132]REL39303.1 acetylglucosamine-6-sulfatase [Rhodohalobacter sp. SW132]